MVLNTRPDCAAEQWEPPGTFGVKYIAPRKNQTWERRGT